ncbi:hypothetical protein Dda_2898 [Drechslerella dactyloides]|uniref:Uncharacterized protein n=1 Tax=Drechslerella dactyloides TaxID=74499 RepID=A0AAD6J0B7_DREDA|nr:hypothetical protein Dda_2898 [Drechslerella dactyloides]
MTVVPRPKFETSSRDQSKVRREATCWKNTGRLAVCTLPFWAENTTYEPPEERRNANKTSVRNIKLPAKGHDDGYVAHTDVSNVSSSSKADLRNAQDARTAALLSHSPGFNCYLGLHPVAAFASLLQFPRPAIGASMQLVICIN